MIAYLVAFLINAVLLFYVCKIVVQIRRKEGTYYKVLSKAVVPLGVVKVLAYIVLVNLFLITIFSLLNVFLLIVKGIN